MEVMKIGAVAKLLHLRPRTVRRLAYLGQIPGRKIGKQWRFSRAVIEAWLENR